MNTMIRLTLGLAAVFLISVAVQAAELSAGALSIGKAEGDVTYSLPDSKNFMAAAAGTALPQGAILKTGANSTASVVFSSGSVAIVKENSIVEVSKFLQEPFFGTMTAGEEPSVSDTELKVQQGEVLSVVAKLRKGSRYTVSSPVGAAGVRGTTFLFSYNQVTKTGRLVVTEGSVVLIFGDRQVTVEAGFSYRFPGGERAPNTPDDLLRTIEDIRLYGPGAATSGFTPVGPQSGPTVPNIDLIGVSVN